MESSSGSPHKESDLNDDHNKLNFIRFYGLPSESQFKCHFTLRKIYMPRKDSIDDYFTQLRKNIGQYGTVSILQLSNVYKNNLVDVDIGMMYDKDAVSIITTNTPIKLPAKDGGEIAYKPAVATVFKTYMERELKATKLLEKTQNESLHKKVSDRNELLTIKPKEIHKPMEKDTVIRVIGVPKQYDKQELIEALRKHPEAEIVVKQADIKQSQEVGMFCYLIWLSEHDAEIVLNYGFEIKGIPLLVLQKNDLSFKSQLSEHQIRVMSIKEKALAKYIYNIFRKVGVIVNLFDFNSNGNNFLITFCRKKSAQNALARQFEGLKLVAVDKNQAFRLQRISIKSIFYSYLRSEQ